jgi:hypothetical protein
LYFDNRVRNSSTKEEPSPFIAENCPTLEDGASLSSPSALLTATAIAYPSPPQIPSPFVLLRISDKMKCTTTSTEILESVKGSLSSKCKLKFSVEGQHLDETSLNRLWAATDGSKDDKDDTGLEYPAPPGVSLSSCTSTSSSTPASPTISLSSPSTVVDELDIFGDTESDDEFFRVRTEKSPTAVEKNTVKISRELHEDALCLSSQHLPSPPSCSLDELELFGEDEFFRCRSENTLKTAFVMMWYPILTPDWSGCQRKIPHLHDLEL